MWLPWRKRAILKWGSKRSEWEYCGLIHSHTLDTRPEERGEHLAFHSSQWPCTRSDRETVEGFSSLVLFTWFWLVTCPVFLQVHPRPAPQSPDLLTTLKYNFTRLSLSPEVNNEQISEKYESKPLGNEHGSASVSVVGCTGLCAYTQEKHTNVLC